ncbi:MAG: efflux transporter periplasmic adaptor subunit, partial [Tannerellaceae bacterium]
MRKMMYLCLAALLVSCNGEEKKNTDPLTVKVYKVDASGVSSNRDYAFLSKPFKTTDLSFRVGGPVTDFDTQSGQFFRKGAVIAAI